MPSFREQTKDGYKALKKKLVQLARVDKSFTKHVKQLHVYERNEEKIAVLNRNSQRRSQIEYISFGSGSAQETLKDNVQKCGISILSL